MKIAGVRFMDARTMAWAAWALRVVRPVDGSLVIEFPNDATAQDVSVVQTALGELGGAVAEILAGADAKKVFGQHRVGRAKPKLIGRDFIVAVIYWSVRAALGAGDSQAIEKAGRAAQKTLRESGCKPWKLARTTITDIAKRERKHAFEFLYSVANEADLPAEFPRDTEHALFQGMCIVSKPQLRALERHLERKSARPER